MTEVGQIFGVTRERIRQVCEAFEQELAGKTIAAPALERVLNAAARVAPTTAVDVNEQFERFIGSNAGIEALEAWAEVLGYRKLPIKCVAVRTMVRGEPVRLTMVQHAEETLWVIAMIRHVSRDISMFGCTNVLRIAGLLAIHEELAPGREAMEVALEETAGFHWLDKKSGWFTLGDTSSCSAATRVRKMIAVAHDTIGTDEIAAALASDDVWMYREVNSLGLATPPVHVLRELIRRWDWLRVVQKGRFQPAPEFDPAGALTTSEEAAVDLITSLDGVACRFELKELFMEKLGFSDVLLATVLGSSPVFERVEHGLYRVRGRRMGNTALAAARQRVRERSSVQHQLGFDLGPNAFCVQVSEAALKNEQYHVPTQFLHVLEMGKSYQVVNSDGDLLGQARVRQCGVLAGINKLFPEAVAGDRFKITILSDGLSVELLRSPSKAHQAELTLS